MRRHSDGCRGFLLLASYLLVLLVLARPMGMCLARMVNDIPLPGPAGVERVLWRVAGIRAEEMGWLQYLLALLLFNALGGGAVCPADAPGRAAV